MLRAGGLTRDRLGYLDSDCCHEMRYPRDHFMCRTSEPFLEYYTLLDENLGNESDIRTKNKYT
jgi:hypothetical protein